MEQQNKKISVEDFDKNLPSIILNTIEDTLKSLEEYGELGPYLNWVDTLDCVCKECYVTNGITKKQWHEIMSKFEV